MAITPGKPLQIQFGGNTALIQCADPTLQQLLACHFRYCLNQTGPVVAVYRLTLPARQTAQLERDDELLYRGASTSYLCQCLMQDLTMQLTAHCRRDLVFHAAGLARAEYGLILCGASGRGKSTLAAKLIASGYDYLTDELVAVSPERAEMRGLARSLALKEGSASVWQNSLTASTPPDLTHFSNGVSWLAPELLRPDCVRHSAQPRLLLFPDYTAGHPFTAQPLSTAKAVLYLMQALINAKNLPDQGFSLATHLARQTKAYGLTYSDASRVSDWLEAIIRKDIS